MNTINPLLHLLPLSETRPPPVPNFQINHNNLIIPDMAFSRGVKDFFTMREDSQYGGSVCKCSTAYYLYLIILLLKNDLNLFKCF